MLLMEIHLPHRICRLSVRVHFVSGIDVFLRIVIQACDIKSAESLVLYIFTDGLEDIHPAVKADI